VATLTLYFDRCFGKRLPEVLEKIRPPFTVEWHHSKKNNFPDDFPDDQWLEICGKKKWVALSHDKKFQDISVEAAAIRQHKVACFHICGGSLPVWYKLCYLIKAYPRMVELTSKRKPPFLFRISPANRFSEVKLP
jgi:hypothetical protein